MHSLQKKKRAAICHGPNCSLRGSAELAKLLDAEIEAQGLDCEVGTRPGACSKLCEEGPSMVVHPERVWYFHLTPEAVREIVRSHLSGGPPVTRFVARDLGPPSDS